MSVVPDFAIVGGQKCGSTLIAQVLASHSSVWLPPDETTTFRDPVFSEQSVAGLREEYAKHGSAKVHGIKCADYLGREEVAARLAETNPAMKILVALRDPISRAVSTYFWYMRWGFLPLCDPAIGVQRLIDGYYENDFPASDEVLEWGLFGQHLQQYLRYFSPDNILTLFVDDLRASNLKMRLSDFVGLDNAGFHNSPKQANEGIYSLQRLRFLRTRNRFILHWDESHTYATIPRADWFWPRVCSNAIAAADRFVLSRILSNDRPRLPFDLHSQLLDYYSDDITLLERITGRDLSAWRAPSDLFG